MRRSALRAKTMKALEAGAKQVVAAIKAATREDAWTFKNVRALGGLVMLTLARRGEELHTVLSPRQADWLAQVIPSPVGAFTLRAFQNDPRIDVEIDQHGRPWLSAHTIEEPFEVQLTRTLAERFKNCAQRARAAVQKQKDGPP